MEAGRFRAQRLFHQVRVCVSVCVRVCVDIVQVATPRQAGYVRRSCKLQVLFADVVFMFGGCADVSRIPLNLLMINHVTCRSRVTFMKYLCNIIFIRL
jgi:hypothetical protein